MAQSKRKTTSPARKKTPARSSQAQGGRSSQGSTRSAASQSTRNISSKPPRRREAAALICLLLGLFSFIGHFDASPLFIGFLTVFVKGLIGNGSYVLPPALILCSVILAFHKGYPVLLRTISTLSLTVVTGALWHTIFQSIFTLGDPKKYELSFSMLGRLWTDGVALKSGGILAGSISQLFLVLFGDAATIITLIIITTALVMIAFNATAAGILSALRNREKRVYEPQPEYPYDDEPAAGTDEKAESYQEQHRHRFPLLPSSFRKKNIDIPLDERKPRKKDYFADDPMSELYNKTPNVKPPDEVLKDAPPWEASKQGTAFDGSNPGSGSGTGYGNDTAGDPQGQVYDLPLDIPFINEKWEPVRRPPPVVPPIEEAAFMSAGNPAAGIPPNPGKTKKKMPVVPPPEGAAPGSVSEFESEISNTAGMADDGSGVSYAFPPLSLLSSGDPRSRAGDNEVATNTERLEAAFQSFGINVNITNATRGPSVTRYEAELEAGIKLSRLTSLSDDIALALGTIGVRIAAMPNRISTVGIEVPNNNISKVHLRDVIESAAFAKSPSKLTFAIGMDISGQPIVGEIPKLPHMLVAGTTGSGKSVCLNSIILSILYKATPRDVRFIMLDPKMVEFKVYNSIPHLLVPVVTDVKKAAGALQWATFEMMKRYNMFSETNARDIDGYNKIAQKSNEEREPLPNIVVVIDELADLMMMAAKEVEESVCRIAQMGRAAGIHLIIATQSPRANVITGLMKANIPSRIAFKVASALESQIILDPGQNADKLVGNGDMLYSPTGAGKPMRLQGTWVSDKERERVVDFIKSSGETQYSEEVMHEIDKAAINKSSGSGGSSGGDADGGPDYDELLPQAVDVILETGQASVSLLQRRLKLGYARAARIVDQMEEMGVVGAFEGSKPREILVTREQWQQMQYGTGVAPVERNEHGNEE